MRESVIHSSANGNAYLYDARHMFSMLIHPALGKVHSKLTEADSYYHKKHAYLQAHDFYGSVKPPDFETELGENVVKNNLLNSTKIVFEVTDHCNLNCAYCSLGELYETEKNVRKNLNSRYAINLLKYVFDLQVKQKNGKLMIDFYGGEPLANIRLIKKIVEAANQLNAGKALELEFSMTTNATLLDEHIHFLVSNQFRLAISLDGNAEGHSYRTFARDNKNSFRKVIENLDMIQRDFPSYFAGNISFISILHKRNSVKSIYNFIYNRYQQIPEIMQLNTGFINPAKKEQFERIFQNRRKSEEEYQDEAPGLVPGTHEKLISYNEANRFLRSFSVNFYLSNIHYLLYDRVIPVPTGTCKGFEGKIFLNTQHNLFPCEKISYKYALGRVNEKVIIDVPAIAKKHSFYFEKIKKVCQKCYAFKSCSICMWTIENLEKLDNEELVCPGFQDHEAFAKNLDRIFSFLEKIRMIFYEEK